jgi:hypothetical protein
MTFSAPSSQPPFGTTGERPPLVAGLVDLVLERQVGEPAP